MPRIDAYKSALELAQGEFKTKDPTTLALNSGATYLPDSKGAFLEFSFLSREIRIFWPEGGMISAEGAQALSPPEQILILHYLLGASGAPLTHTWITFRQIPSGEFYYSAFAKRAKEPLVKTFGPRPELLVELGIQMGGTRGEEGDVSICFQAFPRIPVCLVLWTGDDEFPPDGNLLFDVSISQYLSTEDIAVLSGMVVYPLIGLANKK